MSLLSYVHVRRLTPAPGLIFHSLIAAAMVLYGTIDSLIDFFSFTAWIFYGGAMLALIVMRYTKPNYPRPYKVIKLFFFKLNYEIMSKGEEGEETVKSVTKTHTYSRFLDILQGFSVLFWGFLR